MWPAHRPPPPPANGARRGTPPTSKLGGRAFSTRAFLRLRLIGEGGLPGKARGDHSHQRARSRAHLGPTAGRASRTTPGWPPPKTDHAGFRANLGGRPLPARPGCRLLLEIHCGPGHSVVGASFELPRGWPFGTSSRCHGGGPRETSSPGDPDPSVAGRALPKDGPPPPSQRPEGVARRANAGIDGAGAGMKKFSRPPRPRMPRPRPIPYGRGLGGDINSAGMVPGRPLQDGGHHI